MALPILYDNGALPCVQVCDKLADLLPKRLGITQLLPPQSSTPSLLLHFCHHDIRHQLRVSS